MEWLDKVATAARSGLAQVFPAFGAVTAARDAIEEAVAQQIREAACAKGFEMLRQVHRNVLFTVAWQNSLLAASLLPVWVFRSPIPFYLAYAAVACYTVYSVATMRHIVLRLIKTRSVTDTVSAEVLNAIEVELGTLHFIKKKGIELLGPDLKKIADEVARKLRADVLAVAGNMALTLLLAFVAFRLFAIPLLEHRALA
ncbi:hypothetical protein [Paraburkholderia youngii]|uniref:hypothetical protein n=1 Tax=Paraburkholderia youngii TaxID=2782701 RepID=UPI003D229671